MTRPAPRAYLIGVPGAGKTTLLRGLTAGLAAVVETHPLAHVTYWAGPRLVAVELGGRHVLYGGTDRLSYSAQALAIDFVGQVPPGVVVVAEGDRLANRAFLDAFGGQVVWLATEPDVAAIRRAGRGSSQDVRWLKGRATKVARLAAAYGATRLDGNLAPAALRAAAVAAVPAYAALVEPPA